MKKLLLTLFMILATATAVSAAQQPTVKVGEKSFDCIISDSRTYIPMRDVFEALGYTVDWYSAERAVALTKDGNTVTLLTGSNIVAGRGELTNKVIITDGHTYLPLRELLGVMGYDVTWDNDTKTAKVIVKGAATTTTTTTTETATEVTTESTTETTTEATTEATTETTTQATTEATTQEQTVIEYEDFYIDGEKIENSDELREYIFKKILENRKPTVAEIEAMIGE